MSAREDFLALEQIRRDTISVPRAYIDIAGGDIASGVMLAQLLYWFGDTDQGTKRTRIVKDGRDWIAKRWEEWHKECRLSPDQARRCVENLLRLNLIDKEVWRFQGSPTVHLSLNFEAVLARHREVVAEVVAQMDLVKTPDGSGQITRSIPGKRPDPLTETTTETTTKKKSARPARPSVVIPDPPPEIDSPGLRAFLPEFFEYRKTIGHPIKTNGPWKRIFGELKKAGKDHAVLALRYSMLREWRGFEMEWLKDKSWEQVASELGLSLRKEAARIDPEAIARADRKAAREARSAEFQNSLLLLLPSSDGWTDPARSTFRPPVALLDDDQALADRLAHVEALTHRLTALGAFPLQRPPTAYRAGGEKFEPGLIFPACGGGPWRPVVTTEGWSAEHASWDDPVSPKKQDDPSSFKIEPPADPYGPWKAVNPDWPCIDDPVSPNPPSDEEISAAHKRLTASSGCGQLTPLHAPGDIVLIDGDPVSREAIERNYGEARAAKCPRCGAVGETEAETLCQPGVDECPMTWTSEWPLAGSTGDPNVVEGLSGAAFGPDYCPRCAGEPYFGLRHELCADCLDVTDISAHEDEDDWDDEGTHVCGDRSEP